MFIASCIPSNPTVRNIKILGDFKVNKKIKICGTVIGGTEQASIVQLFVAISENFDMEENLKAISESKTEKEFYLPLEVVGHYVVVKYTPMSEDGKFGEPVFVTSNKMVERKIVRDRNIFPMQVLSWKDIPNKEKQHMWEAVKDEIVKTIMSNPSLSNLEVAEKHFGKQRHGHVYAYGGGVKRKNFNDSKSTYIKELEAKLHGKDEGNPDLKRRMDVFENRLI
nr:Leucine rich repeat 4 [Ipomoea trifida]